MPRLDRAGVVHDRGVSLGVAAFLPAQDRAEELPAASLRVAERIPAKGSRVAFQRNGKQGDVVLPATGTFRDHPGRSDRRPVRAPAFA